MDIINVRNIRGCLNKVFISLRSLCNMDIQYCLWLYPFRLYGVLLFINMSLV